MQNVIKVMECISHCVVATSTIHNLALASTKINALEESVINISNEISSMLHNMDHMVVIECSSPTKC